MIIGLCGCPTIDGRPPEYSVENPCAIPDGSSGAIVAYQVNNGNEASTYVQRLDASGEALWGKKGVELGSGYGGFGGGQGDFAALTEDGQGNVIVVYPQKDTLWARKLDMEGNASWPADGVRISVDEISTPVYFKAIGDGFGGVITAWAAGENILNLQRMDANGVEVWSTAVETAGLDKFDIAGDDGGNVFIIWKDNPSYSAGNIFAQKVDAEGQVFWPIGSLLLTNMDNLGYIGGRFNSQIIADDEGGALAVWVHAVLIENGRSIVGHDLYAQHISSKGEILWGDKGVFVARMALDPRIIGDAPANTIIFWGGLQDVYAQRLDAAGNIVWPDAGINVAQAGERSNVIYYYTATDGTGGFVITWNHADGDNRFLYAQRVDANSNKLWGDNGIRVSSVSPYWGGYTTPARRILRHLGCRGTYQGQDILLYPENQR